MVNGSLNLPMRGKISSSQLLLSLGRNRYALKKPYDINSFFSNGLCAATILGAITLGGKTLDNDALNMSDIGAKADEVLECFEQPSLGKSVRYVGSTLDKLTLGYIVKLSDLEAGLKNNKIDYGGL